MCYATVATGLRVALDVSVSGSPEVPCQTYFHQPLVQNSKRCSFSSSPLEEGPIPGKKRPLSECAAMQDDKTITVVLAFGYRGLLLIAIRNPTAANGENIAPQTTRSFCQSIAQPKPPSLVTWYAAINHGIKLSDTSITAMVSILSFFILALSRQNRPYAGSVSACLNCNWLYMIRQFGSRFKGIVGTALRLEGICRVLGCRRSPNGPTVAHYSPAVLRLPSLQLIGSGSESAPQRTPHQIASITQFKVCSAIVSPGLVLVLHTNDRVSVLWPALARISGGRAGLGMGRPQVATSGCPSDAAVHVSVMVGSNRRDIIRGATKKMMMKPKSRFSSTRSV